MEKRWDAYLAVALDGDDVEIQVDGHAGDIAQIAAMALADVIVQSSPEKEQAIKMLDDMKNRLDGMLDDAWNARSSEIEYGERQSVRWHCEKDTAIEEAMAKLKENTNTGCFGDCATCSGAAVDDRAGTGSRPTGCRRRPAFVRGTATWIRAKRIFWRFSRAMMRRRRKVSMWK